MQKQVPRADPSEVADAMTNHQEAVEFLLDRATGEVVAYPIDGGDLDDEIISEVDADPDRFVPIPTTEARDDHARMERFAAAIDEADVAQRLVDALAGKGAFTRFRAVLAQYPDLRERWYAAEREELEARARQWLASIGVAPVAPPPPMPAKSSSPTATRASLRLGHVLALGAADGKTEIIDGRLRRVVQSHTEGEARRTFKELARDLYESNGVAWRNRFIEGKTEVALADLTVRLAGRVVEVEMTVPPEILVRFYGR